MLLEANKIHKHYGNLHVLRGVDIYIKATEIVSIVGASGAGKSSLLHILGTLDHPDQGYVLFEGEKINYNNSKSLSEFRNENIGFVFQFHHLLPEFSALENICMPAWIKGMKRSEAENDAMKLLNLLQMQSRSHHKPSQLSGGEQQRVAVARALINKPKVVFADEPSGNLDSHHASMLHQLFFDLRQELGQTFVIVTHNEELAAMADRSLVMRDGLVI